MLHQQVNSSEKKWLRKGDIEELKERKYYEEMERKKGIKRKETNEQDNHDRDEQDTKKLKTSNNDTDPNINESNQEDEENLETIPRFEVFRLLRTYGEPITLFGETDELRLKRLKNIQTTRGEFKGQQNDFARALKEREQEVIDEVNIDTEESKKEKIKYKGVIAKKENEDSSEFVLRVLKRLMKEWHYSLDELPEHVKKSAQGKRDATILKQTKSYIKPLFKLLKKKQLADEILNYLEPICKFLSEKEYVKANDIYLQLAIGNQPWTIGVTMVGIHARTARERIGSDKIKHILNDEEQRRYVQSVKRLMTIAQELYPTVPSKMVDAKV